MASNHKLYQRRYIFLESTPYNTLVAPSNTGLLISCGSYNSNTGSLAIDSSRGFPRNAVKPDFTAPGVEILGPLPRKRYGRKSGTSVSGAITAGIAKIDVRMGIMQKNDMQINTTRIKNYLIRGARRDPERIYPNREWGMVKWICMRHFWEFGNSYFLTHTCSITFR